MPCGGTADACSTALAQLAITGREAFNTFVRWNPSFAPASSGPQVIDLVHLVRAGQPNLPAITSRVTAAQLTVACTKVLNQAYTALWSIRSNQTVWRQFRINSGWIAVSGEDDAPHRPVNVVTAPYPQFDIPVPVMVGGQSATLTARYMIAADATRMNINPGASPTPAPVIPEVTIGNCVVAAHRCSHRLAIPDDNPVELLNDQARNRNVIIYIHGGGSRLEEAVPMATQFVTAFPNWSNNVLVLSFDLPNSGYDDPFLTTARGQRVALDASDSSFENGPNGSSPSNFRNFPILNFTLNFINNIIQTLDIKGVLDARRVIAVMGGSLGGNTSLLLSMDPMTAPFHLNNPLSRCSRHARRPAAGHVRLLVAHQHGQLPRQRWHHRRRQHVLLPQRLHQLADRISRNTRQVLLRSLLLWHRYRSAT